MVGRSSGIYVDGLRINDQLRYRDTVHGAMLKGNAVTQLHVLEIRLYFEPRVLSHRVEEIR